MKLPQWKTVPEKLRKEVRVRKVMCPKAKSFVENVLKKAYGFREGKRPFTFPGAQPFSIERRNLKFIPRNKYYVCAKCDGERMLIVHIPDMPFTFLKKSSSQKLPCTFLVNRKLDVFLLPFSYPEYFGASVVDGELMSKGGYIAHDCTMSNGVMVRTQKFGKRLEHLENVCRLKLGGMEIRAKSFYPSEAVGQLFDEMSENEYPCDGVVFYPDDQPVGYKRHKFLYKWKPPGNHTIDTKCRALFSDEGGVVECYAYDGENFVILRSIPMQEVDPEILQDIPHTPGNNLDYELKEMCPVVESRVTSDTMTPFMIRRDKKYPNSVFTIEKTILNAIENITEDDIICVLTRTRDIIPGN